MLDPTRLARSLNEIVRRHEALRTTFHEVDGTPFQSIASDAHACAAGPRSARPAATRPNETAGSDPANRAHAPVRSRRADPCCGPSLVAMFRHRARAVADATSHRRGRLVSRAVHRRAARALRRTLERIAGRVSTELPIQYADYALWQRSRIDADLAAQIAYWTRQLDGAPRVLDLPFDGPWPDGRGRRERSSRFEIPAALARPARIPRA